MEYTTEKQTETDRNIGGVIILVLFSNDNDFEDVLLMEFLYLVFTRMPGESHHGRLRSLFLYLSYVFRGLTDSLVLILLHQ